MNIFKRMWNWITSTVRAVFTGIYSFFAWVFTGFRRYQKTAPTFSPTQNLALRYNNNMLESGREYGTNHALGTISDMIKSLSKRDVELITSAHRDLLRSGPFFKDGKEISAFSVTKAVKDFLVEVASKFYTGNRSKSWVKTSVLETIMAYVYKQDPRFYLDKAIIDGKIQFSNKINKPVKRKNPMQQCVTMDLSHNVKTTDGLKNLRDIENFNALNDKLTRALRRSSLAIDGTTATMTDERLIVLDLSQPNGPTEKIEAMRAELDDFLSDPRRTINTNEIINYLQAKGLPISLRWKYQIKVDFSKLDPANPGQFLPNSEAITQTFSLEAIDPNLSIWVHDDLKPSLQLPAATTPEPSVHAPATEEQDIKNRALQERLLQRKNSVSFKANSNNTARTSYTKIHNELPRPGNPS